MTTKRSSKRSATRFLESEVGALTLGKLVEAIRLGEEMTQTEFAERLGVSRSHLCDIEKGRKLVSPERAVKFAKILRYGEDQFLCLALQAQVEQAGLRFNVSVQTA